MFWFGFRHPSMKSDCYIFLFFVSDFNGSTLIGKFCAFILTLCSNRQCTVRAFLVTGQDRMGSSWAGLLLGPSQDRMAISESTHILTQARTGERKRTVARDVVNNGWKIMTPGHRRIKKVPGPSKVGARTGHDRTGRTRTTEAS